MTRPKGRVNRKTEERLEELRSRFALGQTEEEALREILVPEEDDNGETLLRADGKPVMRELTRREKTRLLTNHYASAGPENNAHFYTRATLRWSRRQAEVARVLSLARGVRHPNAGKVRNLDTGERFPEYEVKPNASLTLQAIRVADGLDRTLLDTAEVLGMIDKQPVQVDLRVSNYEEMSEGELQGLLKEKVGKLFAMMKPEEARSLGVTIEAELKREERKALSSPGGNGVGGNGKGSGGNGLSGAGKASPEPLS